nr:hypothetical protein [Candidatus Sigynarchaeota archaeon]
MLLALKADYEKKLPKNQAGVQFSFAHVVLALFLFDMYGKMGRVELENQLSIGRGSVRTFTARMKAKLGLIESSSTKAHILSDKGKAVMNKIKEEFTLIGNIPVIFDELKFAKFNALGRLAIPGLDEAKIEQGEPLRLVEAAKAQGGKGLISLVIQAGRALKLLGVPLDMKKRYTSEWIRLNELFSLNERDMLLIAWADSELGAKLAVISAAVEALEMMK